MVAIDEGIIEATGTIATIYPVEHDGSSQWVMKLILENVHVLNNIAGMDASVLAIVSMNAAFPPIPFELNSPITVKGILSHRKPGQLSVLHTLHAPVGFIRYRGKIYR